MRENEQQRWSDELQSSTSEELEPWVNLGSVPYPIPLKHIGSNFGLINPGGVTSEGIVVTDRETGEQTIFADVDALVRAGWALD